MAAKGYTSAAAVGAYLGRTLTSAQITQATALLAAAEQVVDSIANTTWLTGQVVAEQYNLVNRGTRLYLAQKPVTSVEAVIIRSYRPNDAGVLLNQASGDYELLDPLAGLLVLSGTYSNSASFSTYGDSGGSAIYSEGGTLLHHGQFSGQVALVSYTPVQVVPPAISLATSMLAAFWITNQIEPARYGLTEIRSADQAKRISDALAQGVIPLGVVDIIQRTNARVLL